MVVFAVPPVVLQGVIILVTSRIDKKSTNSTKDINVGHVNCIDRGKTTLLVSPRSNSAVLQHNVTPIVHQFHQFKHLWPGYLYGHKYGWLYQPYWFGLTYSKKGRLRNVFATKKEIAISQSTPYAGHLQHKQGHSLFEIIYAILVVKRLHKSLASRA